MSYNKKYILIFLLSGILLYLGCKPDPSFTVATDAGFDISFDVPQGWSQPSYNFEGNTLTKEGFILGRELFYDTRFSRDNSTSCGSCHQPTAAFAHADHDLSHGVDGLEGTRNSPSLFNLNWHTSFFWDGGVNHIESQPIAPITNPVEMDETVLNVIAKLEQDQKYKELFRAAWGDETVNSQRIFKSMAQFMGAMVSDNAKYDKFQRAETGLTASETAGMEIFESKCASCHKAPLFTDFSFRNNGLKLKAINDSGRAHITRLSEDLYKFKVPSLRNLKYSAPYMHDGRFNTLEQVLDHYATGIHQSATLDAELTNGIQLTAQERANLLAFLNTLNDEEFIRDRRFYESAN